MSKSGFFLVRGGCDVLVKKKLECLIDELAASSKVDRYFDRETDTDRKRERGEKHIQRERERERAREPERERARERKRMRERERENERQTDRQTGGGDERLLHKSRQNILTTSTKIFF